MDNEKEIPFGAFDSELMHQEITIPEGFEATIDGDKIILTRIENEDERVRKALITYFQRFPYGSIEKAGTNPKEAIAWLEKQGENKEINEVSYRIGIKRVLDNPESYGLEKQGEQKFIDYNEELKKCRENPLYFFDKYVKIKERKSVWSVEDQNALEDIKEAVVNYWGGDTQDILLHWLKFLKNRVKSQNTWKPSDEQMDALNDVISSRDIKYDILSELWNDLNKLKRE